MGTVILVVLCLNYSVLSYLEFTTQEGTHLLRAFLQTPMRTFALSIALLLASLPLCGGHVGAHAEYVGGTRADIPTNNIGDIKVMDNTYFVFASKKTQIKIPYDQINLLEYGQKVDRRYLAAIISPMFMFAKTRQHFLTLGFQDENGVQQALVFRVDKKDIRVALVALEARTGQQIRYQDEQARIAGKG